MFLKEKFFQLIKKKLKEKEFFQLRKKVLNERLNISSILLCVVFRKKYRHDA